MMHYCLMVILRRCRSCAGSSEIETETETEFEVEVETGRCRESVWQGYCQWPVREQESGPSRVCQI